MSAKGFEQEIHHLFPTMTSQVLRKVVWDVTTEINKIEKQLEIHAEHEQIMQAECKCCGLKEECTKDYISRIRNSYSGNWVCGLCSEAVKERAKYTSIAIEEAVSSHRNFCEAFNSTTRLNPKLSLTWAMREIAKRSSENRKINLSKAKIARSSSYVPRFHDLIKNY